MASSTLTDQGRDLILRAVAEGLSYTLDTFSIGTYGYDTVTPTNELAVDPTATALTAQVLTKAVETHIIVNEIGGVACVCRLADGEGEIGIGEWGLWATIQSSPTNAGEVGSQILFALLQTPLQTKDQDSSMIKYFTISY